MLETDFKNNQETLLLSTKSVKSRYYRTPYVKTDDGTIVYSLYKEVDMTNVPTYTVHTVDLSEKNRIDKIAVKYYGDVSWWWLIAQYNKMIDPFVLQPNTQLKIPTIQGYTSVGIGK